MIQISAMAPKPLPHGRGSDRFAGLVDWELMNLGRREFLAMPALLAVARATDARIEEIRTDFADYRYRAPYKFGGKEVDRVTMLNVHCRLRSRAGKTAEGFG